MPEAVKQVTPGSRMDEDSSPRHDWRNPGMPFLCDAMLGQLGHWLRAAGYDTLIAANRTSDRALIMRAVADRRILLTRDRKLMEIREARDRAVLLRAERLGELAAEITPRFGIDWLAKPFSRCLVCNLPLSPAPKLARERLPAAVLSTVAEINYCRQCDKLYWAGGHVRRILQRLERWHAGEFA
jgi:uncharacterized protein with PIN domain